MLHRSFKPAKCKTTLKLATSRIKLLKNKKEAQVKQLKRELAQLLESGQDRTARIRVEHVIREEKMMAAYDLVEIYCELIVARLPIIESQKNCPIDLKEAITSVIFASPRCADIPELLDARKHFTAKYGKEFISAAVELRPDCGVSRMLVEKLSAMAPDVQTKIRVLSAIAEEHNVKWDSKSFGETESKPPDDLLNGPNSFEKASKMHAEPPNFQAPNVQSPLSHDQKHDAPLNFSEQKSRSSLDTQNFTSTDTGGIKTTISATSYPDVRPSEMGAERMEVRQSYHGDGTAFSLGRQNWNMEFNDATSAAQAAAESAERASMAARAAAELSSQGRITRQYSTESQKSNIHVLRDEGPGTYAASKLAGEHLPRDSVNNSFPNKNPKSQNERIDGNEHDNLAGGAERFYRDGHSSTKRSSQSASLRSSKASIDDDTLVNSLQKEDKYFRNSLSEKETSKAEMSMKKESGESEVEFVSGRQDAFKPENFDYFGEERIRKQSSTVSSHSHSSTFGDDYNVSNSNHSKFGNDAGTDPYVGIDEGSIHRHTMQMSSNDAAAAAVFFDESGSDDEDCRFDMGPKYDEQESKSYMLSPGRKSPGRPSTNTDSWSPRRNTSKSLENFTSQSHFSGEWHSSPEFSESLAKSVDPSQSGNFVPVTFDDSDGSNSEREDEPNKSRLGGTQDSSIFSRKQNFHSINPELTQSESHGITGSSFAEEGNSGSDKRPWLRSSSDDLDPVEVHLKNNQGTELNADSPKKFGFESLASQRSPRLKKSHLELNDMDGESSFYNPVDEGNHQQSLQPSRHSSVDEVNEKFPTPQSPDRLKANEFLNQSSSESGKELNFGTLTGGLRNKGYRRPPYTRSPSGDASSSSKKASEESSSMIEQSTDFPTVKSSDTSGLRTKAVNISSSRMPNIHSDSDTDDSRDEFPQETLASRQEPYAQKAGQDVNANSSLRARASYFDSDSGDSDQEDLPKQTLTSRGRLGSGLSRRTKASPSSSEARSYSKIQVGSEASAKTDSGVERKPIPTRRSYGAETPPKPRSQTVNSGKWGSSEQPISAKHAAFKPMPESKISSREENLKSSAVEQPSSPLRRTVASGSTENPKTSTSSGETSTRADAAKKTSHVHPKLPDYDTIAARLQSLRSNR